MSAVAAGVSAVVGVWLMAAPDVLGYARPASSVHRVVGPVVATLGIVALWRVVRVVLRGSAVGAAVLVVATPFDLPGVAVVNGLVCAAMLGALALVPIRGDDRFAGGWIGLARRWREGDSPDPLDADPPPAPDGPPRGY